MSASWKTVIVVVAAIVVLNLGLAAVRASTGGTPGGPASSSYATSADGAAAFAELLSKLDYRVDSSRVFPHQAQLTPRETAIVLDPPAVVPEDATALRRFVARGGRLVLAATGRALRAVVPSAPDRTGGAKRFAVDDPAFPDVHVVRTAGLGAWAGPRRLVASVRIGRGEVLLLADPSPLRNRLLGKADNARLAVDLAGSRTRPVVFFEAYHGYGRGSGILAVPGNWRDALILASVAAIVFALARIRRLGPPEDESRYLPPARREYVDAVARTLERTRDREQSLAPLRDDVLRRIVLQSGVSPDAPPETITAAATRLGFERDEAEAVAGPLRRGDELALGSAYIRARKQGRREWRN